MFEQISTALRQRGVERGVVETSSFVPCNAAQSIFPALTCGNSGAALPEAAPVADADQNSHTPTSAASRSSGSSDRESSTGFSSI